MIRRPKNVHIHSIPAWRVLRLLVLLGVIAVVLFAAWPTPAVPAFARGWHSKLRGVMYRANVVAGYPLFRGAKGDSKPTLHCLQVHGSRPDTGIVRLYAMHDDCRPEAFRFWNDNVDTLHFRILSLWRDSWQDGNRERAIRHMENLARYYCEQHEFRPAEVYVSVLREYRSFATGETTSGFRSLAAYDCSEDRPVRDRFPDLHRGEDGALEVRR